MERTSRRRLQPAPYRQAHGTQSRPVAGMGMARRPRDQRATVVFLTGLAVFAIACFGLAAAASRLASNWRGGAQTAAAASAPPVTAPETALGAGLAQFDRPVNILLLGSDQRGDDPGYRTDVIVLVSIDPLQGTASAVSFPRDLWVESPTLSGLKINMVQGLGGFEALAEVFETSFGVRVDYYVLTNFSGFINLIDSLGGIDVHMRQPLTDSCDLPQAQGGICALDEGVLAMDGQTALWYVRSRGTTSDMDRLRRAQEVVQAVFERMMHLDALANLPHYYNEIAQDVETNLDLGDVIALVPAATRLIQEPDRIRRFVIDEGQAYPMWSWNEMWILMPEPEAVRGLLDEAGIATGNQ